MIKRTGSLVVVFAATLALVLAAPGCKSSSGSREFIPGKGWRSL